jgi:hypothetical protein
VKLTTACRLPTAADTAVGAPGTPALVVNVAVAEYVVPALLVA